MVSISCIQFINAALFTTGEKSLSYTHHNLKWLIRKHLLSLLAEFPTLSLNTEDFTHNDGTTVRLLNARGFLPLTSSVPPVKITIWLHHNYPFYAPLVFVSLPPEVQIGRDHPFIDPSGETKCPYIEDWLYPQSNVADLARNLVKIFSSYLPFSSSNSITSDCTDASLASRREAMDRLVARLQYDTLRFRTQVEEDIEHLTSIQATLRERAGVISQGIEEHERERASLERAVSEVAVDTDALLDWLTVPSCNFLSTDGMEGFKPVDETSRCLLENEAADRAIEDALDVLSKAMEEGVVTFGDYLKQVRTLSREQFFHRAMVVKLEQHSRMF